MRARWRSLTAKVVVLALISVVAAGTLAGLTLGLSAETQADVHRLMDEGLAAADAASELQFMMEQHRRAVESAPSELNLKRLAALRAEAAETEAVFKRRAKAAPTLLPLLPALHDAAERVFSLAGNFVQDEAYAASHGDYAAAAAALHEELDTWRAAQMAVVTSLSVKIVVTASSLRRWVTQCVFVLCGAGLAGALVACRGLQRLTAVTRCMRRLSHGQVALQVPHCADVDEIGQIARAVEVFRLNALRSREMEAERAMAAERDLARAHAIERQAAGFRTMVEDLLAAFQAAAGRLMQTSDTMRGTAENTRVQAHAAASGSEQATSSAGLVAAAAADVEAAIATIDRQVSQSAGLVQSAKQGFKAVDSRMMQLQAASTEIRSAVHLIQTIAQKTKLLALNATIESARAGNAGRGFSVVAQEVKALASQTARAVREIEGQVDGIQAATSDMGAAVESIVTVVADMEVAAFTVAESTAQQAGAVSQISRNGQLAALRTEEALRSINQVQADARRTGDVAEQVQTDASTLEERANRLRREVIQFIKQVQAA